MKEKQMVFKIFLVLFLGVSLLVGGACIDVGWCQEEPEEEEEPIQTRPRPDTKGNPMLRGKGRLNVVRPTAEITLSEVQKMKADVITLEALKLEKLIEKKFKKAKIIATGKIDRKVTIKGLRISEAAKKAIERENTAHLKLILFFILILLSPHDMIYYSYFISPPLFWNEIKNKKASNGYLIP